MTKTISISDNAYNTLNRLKDKKSFSEIIIEIAKDKSNDKFFSSIGSWDKETAEKIKKKIYKERKLKSKRFS